MNLPISDGGLIPKRRKPLLISIRNNISSWLLIVPSLIFFIVFNWQPLVSGVVLSFFETKGYNAVKFIGLQNYRDVISDSIFRQTITNTFIYVGWSLIIGFLVPIIIAVIIDEMRHLKSFFRFSVYFPGMVPAVAAAMLWTYVFDPGQGGLLNMLFKHLGLANSQWLQNAHLTIPLIVITMTWRGFGGTSLIYMASLQGVNPELYEAASIDGAGIWSKIKNITIPSIMPVIKILLILQIMGVFRVMQEPLTMTEGGPNNASMTLMLSSYFYAFRYIQAGRSMAVCVITFIILLILTMIYFKFNKSNDEE
ncbi:MAG: sugar ABC transporter permease [Clostridiales bacterium]|nr:sugar ABC transporter permease [Clostridiales bacterium]